MPSAPSASSSNAGTPRLPPTATLRPESVRMWPVSAVVVDLPLVPVMPAKRAAFCARTSSSLSPMVGTPAALARAAAGCGFGKVCGMPGDSTSAFAPARSAARLTRSNPARAAAVRRSRASSQATTLAPPFFSAVAAARPDRAKPSTAIVWLRNWLTSIIASPQLEGGQARDREDRGDDPEADDDRRFLPALLLEMVMERRHAEDAPAGKLKAHDLHDHRNGLEHEEAADDHQNELVLGDHGDDAKSGADRQRAGVAHEDH